MISQAYVFECIINLIFLSEIRIIRRNFSTQIFDLDNVWNLNYLQIIGLG